MERLTGAQLVPLSGLLAALIALAIAQWVLWLMFRRRLNKGFLVATALSLATIIWLGASNMAAWNISQHDFASTARPYEQLTVARTAAQEMRTAETVTLLTRNAQNRNASMNDTVAEVSTALDAIATDSNLDAVTAARNALSNWSTAHAEMMGALQSGDYDKAVSLAADGDEQTSRTAFSVLDKTLADLISTSRFQLRGHISDALGTTRHVSEGIMILMLGAIIMVWVGARPRVQEYL